MRSSRYLPFVLLGILPLLWGYSWVPGKLGVMYSNAFVFAALRTFVPGVLLLALLPLTGRPLRPKAVGLTAAVGVLQVGGFIGLTSAAMVAGGAGHTAMLANTWQFWLLFMAWIALGERLRGGQWVAVVLGLAGLVLIIEPWGLRGVLSSLLTLAGALCFAGGAIVAKILRRRHKVDLLSFTAWQTFLGSIPLVVAALLFPGDGIQWTTSFIWSLIYSSLIASALAALVWLYVLNALPANIAGLGTIGTPIIGVLASWLQLDEELSAAEITGMVLVALALMLLALLGLWAGRGPHHEPGSRLLKRPHDLRQRASR
ncbi:MAG: EamA family transporter [Armatimonadetes bacterium]|nr:EamA family transporter [Armatimonadota bacterium]